MINFHEEIRNYCSVNKLSEVTLSRYTTVLYEFCSYLADKLLCKPIEVNLSRIYSIRTPDNIIIGYKSIDSRIIESYLFKNVGVTNYSNLANKTHALRSFFKFLKNNRNFPDVVSGSEFKLHCYKPKTEPIRILSRHEFLRFLQSLVTYSNDLIRDTLLFGLLFSTGCRITEILTLRTSNINLTDEMFILLKTKTKVQRVIVLRQGFGQIIKEYIKTNESEYLFASNKQIDQPLKRKDVHDLFNKYLENAKLPIMRLHSSRHSFATFMRDAGTELFTIMELLGHEKFQSVLHYTQHYTRNPNIKIRQHDVVYSHLRSLNV